MKILIITVFKLFMVVQQMPMVVFLPTEIWRHIFEYDSTYHDMWINGIVPAIRHTWRELHLDRGYTIRNFFEEGWATTPRYYCAEDQRLYGIYIRFETRSRAPL